MDAGIGGVLLMAHTVAGADLLNLLRHEPALRSSVPELDHIVCCNPSVAMCGAVVAGTGVAFGKPEGSRNLCRKCADLDASGKRCAEPGCPGAEE